MEYSKLKIKPQNFEFKEILDHLLKRWTISAIISITYTLSPTTGIANRVLQSFIRSSLQLQNPFQHSTPGNGF